MVSHRKGNKNSSQTHDKILSRISMAFHLLLKKNDQLYTSIKLEKNFILILKFDNTLLEK